MMALYSQLTSWAGYHCVKDTEIARLEIEEPIAPLFLKPPAMQ